MERNDLTLVPGFRAGSAEDADAATGCTVVLAPPGGAVFGMAKLGGATGTREVDPADPGHIVDRGHAVLLTGGSAFGLDAAGGVMRYLEERGVGFETRAARIPITPTAVIYDLAIGRSDVRPGVEMGRAACEEAERDLPLRQGNAGVGCGATVGKLLGMNHAMKGGLGSLAETVRKGLHLGVAVAVNAVGDILERPGGSILAGARVAPDSLEFADSVRVLRQHSALPVEPSAESTILVVVATNARLDKEGARTLARMASAGMSRIVRPVHMSGDGDLVFALAAGEEACRAELLGVLAADLVERAIVRAIREARSLHGVPAVS